MADSISDLADEILGKILSLVPTKLAASTSILSKRYRNLLGLVDTLCFDESVVSYPNEEEANSGSHRFWDFVGRTFALLKNSHIKKITLSHFGSGRDVEDPRICNWICNAMESGLLELYLHSHYYSCVALKRELFTSKTLVKLTLSGGYCIEVQRVFLPQFKSLSLLSVSFLDCDNCFWLIDGCPLLEDLFIIDSHPWYPPCCSVLVKSKSIKKLEVLVDLPGSQEDHRAMLFAAPSLVYLEYSSHVFAYHEVHDLDLLVEARLNLKLWESNDASESEELIFGDVTDLVAGIRNITTLHLSSDSLETFHFCCESMPVFNNLLNLSIESNKDKGWQVMPLLLNSCPNLQTLVIKGLMHRVTNMCGDACACIPKKRKRKILKTEEKLCCLRTCQVKHLEISEYGGSFQELKQMRHFLNNLECLETVTTTTSFCELIC